MGSQRAGGEAVWPDSSPRHSQPPRLAPGFLPGAHLGLPRTSPIKMGSRLPAMQEARQIYKLGSPPTQDQALCPSGLEQATKQRLLSLEGHL